MTSDTAAILGTSERVLGYAFALIRYVAGKHGFLEYVEQGLVEMEADLRQRIR